MSTELGRGLPWPKCLEKAISRLGRSRVEELLDEMGLEPRNLRHWIIKGIKPVGLTRKRIRELFGWSYEDLPPSNAEYEEMPGAYISTCEHGTNLSANVEGHEERLKAHAERIAKEMERNRGIASNS